jgi:hypothetical protein
MSTPPRSGHGETGPARPSGISAAIKLVIGAAFVATLAYVITLLAGATAGVSVPFAPLLAAVVLLAFFIVVYAFAPGPL